MAQIALPEHVRALLERRAYNHDVDDVELIQTHISYVFLAGEFAYKVKKPLDLGFLDYSTLERRRLMCEEEVRLNRRLCDGVYLGVTPITRDHAGAYHVGGTGEVVEYAVRMRRVPSERMMPALLAKDDVSQEHVRTLAATLADFHARSEPESSIAAFGRTDAVRRNWDENFEQTRQFVNRTITHEQYDAIRGYVDRFLEANRPLMDRRVANGRVRDCHGDLRADAVVIWPEGGICVMDCIEFNDRIRFGDVASDIAFLAMDLEFRGYRRLADEFVSFYLEEVADDETLSAVLSFYGCYRAYVRGKVDSIQWEERDVPPSQRREAKDRARRYFALAHAYGGRPHRQALVVMVGLSGTGKSYVANALAARIEAVILRTDAIRGELIGSGAPARYGEGAYTQAERDRVYAALLERAARFLREGRSVVLDATFIRRADRERARDVGEQCDVPLLAVETVASEDLVRARLARRAAAPHPPSDARFETYLEQRRNFETADEFDRQHHVVLDTARELDACLDDALAALDGLLP